MIYYFLLALAEIGFFLSDNWKELTGTAIATGVGVILGKRLGSRIAINYIMRTLGLHKKPMIEQQVAWLIELERGRGNIWSAERRTSNHSIIGQSFRSRWVTTFRVLYVKLYIRRTEMYPLILRRKINMSRKLILMIFGAIITVLSEFGIALDPETIIGIITLLISGILGQSAVDMNGLGQYAPLKQKFKSVKLWTALGGSVLLVISDYYGLNISETVIYLFSGLGATFILGRSAVSVAQASKSAGGKDDQLNIPIEPPL